MSTVSPPLRPNARIQNASSRLATLSPREMEVAQLVCCGDASKVIAFKLGIAQKTVEVHRDRIMTKTESGSLVELARLWEASLHELADVERNETVEAVPFNYPPTDAVEGMLFAGAS